MVTLERALVDVEGSWWIDALICGVSRREWPLKTALALERYA